MSEPSMASTWRAVRCDWAANSRNPKARLVLLGFRASSLFARRRETNRLAWFIGLPIMVTYRVMVEWLMGIELPAKTVVGPGLRLYHGQSLVVYDGSRLGSGVVLRHCTTIGVAREGLTEGPVIGDRVDIGSNSVIVGGVHIGDDAVIGAGCVVVTDVPSRAVVVGNPGRVVRVRDAAECV